MLSTRSFRDVSGCDPTYGAGAAPACGFALRSRAASGIDPAGMTTGLPGVWLSLAAERVRKPAWTEVRAEVTIRQRAKRGPKLSSGASHNKSRGGAPKGERADRKARAASVRCRHWLDAPLGAPLPFAACVLLNCEHRGAASFARGCSARIRERACERLSGFLYVRLSHRTERRFARLKCVA